MAALGEDVYCTLLMSDSYLPGAAVLAHSLRDAGTKKKLAVLVTLDTLSADTIAKLKELYDYVIPVDRIRNPNPANLYLMDRADLAFAFTKIALWRQVQFRKIVYLDADVVVIRAPDELFNIDADFAAAPDVGWPDAFNTGVMVISPNMGDYWALQTMAASGDSFDGADQGLLNQYYEHRNWHRISFTYNCTPNAQYQWEPAYRYYKSNISMVHFIGKDKPWSKGRPGAGGGAKVYNELLARWWAVYDRHLKGAPASRSGRPVSFSHPQASYTANVGASPSTTVQQYVHGETTNADFGTSSFDHITPAPQSVEHEAPQAAVEQPFSDPGEASENIDQGVVEPTPTAQQRKFSAPIMSWDATRSAPPVESKPEAVNFPVQTYTFSENRELFQAPQSYPEPPKDMWYEVPETKPTVAERPKPIFPWERDRELPKPTRVFAEDLPPEPTPPVLPAEPSSNERAEEDTSASPSSVQPATTDENWQSFSQSTNAWDTVPGIEQYVRAIMEVQQRRVNPHVPQPLSLTEEIFSPALSRKGRRESLILTDFPSAVERPSLPVTPAPIRRPTFWGEERDAARELPAAEGVPEQADWVCPRCGFSSDSATSFRRERRLSSTSSNNTTLAASVTPALVPAASVTGAPAAVTPAAVQSPSLASLSSPRGAPLASLTNPSYFPTPSAVLALAAEHGLDLQSESDDPEEKLEQLRRSSLLEFEHLTQSEKKKQHSPPLRELPEHSVPTPSDKQALHHHLELAGGGSPHGLGLDQATILGMDESQQDVEAFEENGEQEDREKEGGEILDKNGDKNGGVKEGDEAPVVESAPVVPVETVVAAVEKPSFKEPDFGADATADDRTGFFDGAADQGVISPMER
ncbi:glycosyltransferase family 8 protein [Glonium stellatum]|uniref:glycogenin glucosyltransferase n=1 Tax=Glonium stellatum TaxID=574774 RepID=A0A8E2JYJ3_9PEZI|nr:glycosyltransferase family 8 protein [Glonium stellatum]